MEREELDLNLTMKESDVPNGFKEYRRCVSLPEKEREVISPCQDIFFVFFSVEMDLLFYVHDLALAYKLKKMCMVAKDNDVQLEFLNAGQCSWQC